ncbi:MAG TPA: DUF222 domain-containing protein [Mycobacteriales bacterium]|nr:DUF222 domain-containing protein [Mycobacteriales bacterium]
MYPANDTLHARADVAISVLEDMPVGPGLVAGLVALRAVAMDGYSAVRVHTLWSKVIAWASAQQMIATYDCVKGVRTALGPQDMEEAFMLAAQEIAAATAIPYSTARAQVEFVDDVSDRLAHSWQALDRGDLTLAHVKALHRATRNCTPAVIEAVDAKVIPLAVARRMTPSQLARAARRLIITIDPQGAAERAKQAKERGDVEFYPGEDETATLAAFGDAEPLRRVMDEIDHRAAVMKRAGDARPIGMLRVQALVDAFFGAAEHGERPSGTAQALVTVDLMTLLGVTDKPGELAGYGPITAETARRIAADATLRRLVTDPMNGNPLDLGRTYRPSKLLRDLVRAARPRCSMIGCSRPAYQCELDHRLEHGDGGDTNPENLQPLCKLHHQLKTKRRWKVGVNADGQPTWTSFLGFSYVSHDRDPELSDSGPPNVSAA